MICPKQEKRNIFSFFRIYNCICSKLKEDELIYIGYKYIKIIYYINTCDYLLSEEEFDVFYTNEKVSYLLNIAAKFNELLVFLWLDEVQYLDKYFEFFDAWISEDLNIIILATK